MFTPPRITILGIGFKIWLPGILFCSLVSFAEVQGQDEAASGQIVYEEEFDGYGLNLGAKGWFGFAGGTGSSFSLKTEEEMGYEGSPAVVFRFGGSDQGGVRSYWYAGLGKNGIIRPEGAQPGDLEFSAFMALPNESINQQIPIRFVQGSTDNPTWSVKHYVDVGNTGDIIRFRLGDGEEVGTYSDSDPITLHAIFFGHDRFGFNRDIEFVIDHVNVTKVD